MNKSDKNIKNNKLMSISELANKLLIEKHTLRFWEDKFKQIKPIILSGRRYYSKKEIEVINLIKFLLKEQGLTIEGAKKILNKNINTLDHYKTSSITSDYFKAKIRSKSKALLEKIKNLKK
tara:strand:- start:105 stop:467 length:363 start_codon:yes stop_codon:yes gene_type:complete